MFKSLRTSTKLLLLCIVFVGALLVATYGLVAEKQIAIDFVRKELVGVQHLEALRGVYATILKANPARRRAREKGAQPAKRWTGSRQPARLIPRSWTRLRSNARSRRRRQARVGRR